MLYRIIFYVAKCNLGKVNLELMLPAVSPSLHMICGGAPLEFVGGKPHTALLSSDRCNQCFCERIFADSLAPPSLPRGLLDFRGKYRVRYIFPPD